MKTFAKSLFCILTILGALFLAGADAVPRGNFAFEELTEWGVGVDNRFTAVAPGGFSMSVKTGESRAVQTACATRDMVVVGQDKLYFTVTGSPANRGAKLQVMLVFREGTEGLTTKWSNPIPITNAAPRQYTLGMSEEFGAADLPSTVAQIKFQLDSGDEPQGHLSQVTLTDIAIRSTGEEGALKGSTIRVEPSPRPLAPAMAEVPEVKIFFDFDNDDENRQINTRWSSFVGQESFRTPGFRDRLLQGCANVLAEAATPAEADVIVYARTDSSPHAEAIAQAVAKGAGLILYGDIHDPILEELAPVALQDIPFSELPPRRSLKIVSPAHPLYDGASPEGKYAYFRSVAARDGSIELSTLGESSAAVLSSNGKILYSTIGIGVSQQRSNEFYDLFFLKAVATVSGKPQLIPLLLQLEKRLAFLHEIRERRDIAEVFGNADLEAELEEWEKKACYTLPDEHLSNLNAKLEEALATQPDTAFSRNGLRYHQGAHANNFGRFGWALEEGLLGANLSRTLAVSNGISEYLFTLDGGECNAIELPRWDRAIQSGNPRGMDDREAVELRNGSFDFEWQGKGTLRYTCNVQIPEEWRGLPLFFEVEKGIDDTDLTTFNGRKIGAVGQETPGYWIEPRRYAIPLESVRYGAENELICEVTNLAGSATFNSRPSIKAVRNNRDKNLTVTDLDWLHKRYEITDGEQRQYSMTLSLAIPYILYETEEAQASFNVENIAEYAAIPQADGTFRVIDLLREPVFYEESRDGKLAEPYILFFAPARSGTPLALYFARNPAKMTAQAKAGSVHEIQITGDKPIGSIVAGWPYGASQVKSDSWVQAVPESVAAQLQQQMPMAFNFPIGVKELYALDFAQNKVQILNRFTLRHLANEFGVTPTDYALLPPLVGFAVEEEILAESEGLHNFHIATDAGPVLGVLDTDTISYSLEMPPQAGFQMLSVGGQDPYKELMKKIFHLAIRWACGGYYPERVWTPQNPQGDDFLSKNFDLCSWGFNLIYCFQSLPYMENAERSRLLQRAGWRYFEPLERYGFKLAFRYREEPFTYTRYPVMLPPFYRSNVDFADNYGSKVIFGDENEPGYIIPAIAQLGQSLLGQEGVTQVNYPFLRDTMAFTLASDDWAVQTSGCRESWQGAFIDMLNCEYPMMREYRRMAEANDDPAGARDALYRASRKMLPTILRFYFQKFMKENQLPNAEKEIRFLTGWTENSGASYLQSNSNYGTTDIFDVAGGISEDTLVLLKTYANSPIRESMKRTTLQLFQSGESYEYPAMLALFGMERKTVTEMIDKLAKNIPLLYTEDHPGMSVFYHLGLIDFTEAPDLFIDRAANLTLLNARFDPATQRAVIDYLPGEKARLQVYATRVPVAITRNGQPVPLPPGATDGVMEFAGGSGPQQLIFQLGDIPNTWRHPIVKDLR